MNSEIQAAFATLQSNLQSSIASLGAQFEARFDENSARMSQVAQRVDGLHADVQRQSTGLASLQAKVAAHEQQLQEVLARSDNSADQDMPPQDQDQESSPAAKQPRKDIRARSAPPKAWKTYTSWRDPAYTPGKAASMEVRVLKDEGYAASEWERYVNVACDHFRLEKPKTVTTNRLYSVSALVTFTDPARADAFRESLRREEYKVEGARMWGDRCRTAEQKQRGWRLRRCAASIKEKLGNAQADVRVDYRGRCIWHGRKEYIRMGVDDTFLAGRHWPTEWSFPQVVLGKEWTSPSRG